AKRLCPAGALVLAEAPAPPLRRAAAEAVAFERCRRPADSTAAGSSAPAAAVTADRPGSGNKVAAARPARRPVAEAHWPADAAQDRRRSSQIARQPAGKAAAPRFPATRLKESDAPSSSGFLPGRRGFA